MTVQPILMTSEPIKFFHRGSVVDVTNVHPTRSVLDWLREDAACTGTKEGCNEGDCGACTVVVGRIAEPGDTVNVGGLNFHTINACIHFLPTLHGKALFTVEDLKDINGGEMHPVQHAMHECHGSQCGFCTPGFVMSLWCLLENSHSATKPPTRQQLADALSGNLCRCTGYRSILDAGQRMFELPPARLDTKPIVCALRSFPDSPLSYKARNPYAADRIDSFYAPRTLNALAALVETTPQACLLAGSTDIGLWINKQFRDLGDIIYLGDVAELKAVYETNGELYIGAGASLEEAWAALTEHVEALAEVWLRFASPPIRNAGTMGGSVANGSPIGDSAPVLMALDATLVLRKGKVTRRVPLSNFYRGYMKNALRPGEFIEAIAVPLAATRRAVRAYKVSKRFDCDISALCAGFAIELRGDTVQEVRIALGGMAAVVKRARATEAVIAGQAWNEDTMIAAQATLATEFQPLTDMRASAEYRLQVAQNLLRRFWLETRVDEPFSPQVTRVWNVRLRATRETG